MLIQSLRSFARASILRRGSLLVAMTALSAAALLACPGPRMPEGPPPEYEDPPPPSWLAVDAGAADAAPPPATSAPDADVAPGA